MAAEVFDADLCAHELLENDEAVAATVREAFGSPVFGADGRISRPTLRELVFADEAKRKVLEGILHPPIQARWKALAASKRESPDWLFADIPLLFETGAEAHLGRVLVIACSPAVQARRLREQRGLTDAMIEKIIGAQLNLSAKMVKADHVIWNDSTVTCLDRQAGLLARWLTQYYG